MGASSTDSAGIILSHNLSKGTDLTHQHLNTQTSILSALTWNESRRMLRQISCGQLTTRSPIIRAIRWTMAPDALQQTTQTFIKSLLERHALNESYRFII